MAAPRVLLQRCSVFARANTTSRISRSILPSIATACSRRHLTSSAKLWEETVQTPTTRPNDPHTDARIEPTGFHARSIALLKVPRRAVKSEIEELLRSKGCEVKNIQLQLDKFTFQNNTLCFAELGSEEQVSTAIRLLDQTQFLYSTIVAKPLKTDFVWGNNIDGTGRYFYEDGSGPREALRPLFEGRRRMLSVLTPGWGKPDEKIRDRNIRSLNTIDQYFGKYGIEVVGAIHPFYGDKKLFPRLLVFMDFTTKEGAEQATADLHDTEIEGRLTWLQPCHLAPWRAHQVGKVDMELLTELQQLGLASEDPYEDKFATPLGKKRKSMASVEEA